MPVDVAVFHCDESRVFREIAAAQFRAQAPVLAVVSATDDDVSVGSRERLVRRKIRILVAPSPRNGARREETRELVRAEVDDRIQQGDIDMLAAAGRVPALDRGQDTDGGVQSGQDVGDCDRGFHRSATRLVVGFAVDAHEAAFALKDEVIARAVRIWAIPAVAGDRAIDEARVDVAEVLVRKPVAGEVADFVVLDENVRLLRQFAHDLPALRIGQIDCNRAFVAVRRRKIRGIGRVVARFVRYPRWPPVTGVVAEPRAFDLDNVRAEIGQHLRAPRACQHPGQVQHQQPRKRSCHVASPFFRRCGPTSVAVWLFNYTNVIQIVFIFLSCVQKNDRRSTI